MNKKSKKPLLITICAVIATIAIAAVFLLPIDYTECGMPEECVRSYSPKCNYMGCASSYTTIWRKATGAKRIYDRPFWKE